MVDWLTYKGQNPWTCVALHGKTVYNEGSYLSKSPKISGGTPIWEVGKTGPAITDTHVPCEYWFKKGLHYVSLQPIWWLVEEWSSGTTKLYDTSYWTSNSKIISGGTYNDEVVKFYRSGEQITVLTGLRRYGVVGVGKVDESITGTIDVVYDPYGKILQTATAYSYSSVETTDIGFCKIALLYESGTNVCSAYSFTSTDCVSWSDPIFIGVVNPDMSLYGIGTDSAFTLCKLTDNTLCLICPVCQNTSFVAPYNNAFLMFTSVDSGLTWTQVSTPAYYFDASNCFNGRASVRTSNSLPDLYIVRYNSTLNYTYIWHTADGGVNWDTASVSFRIAGGIIELFDSPEQSNPICIGNSLCGFVIQTDPSSGDFVSFGYYKSTDFGVTWPAVWEITSEEAATSWLYSLIFTTTNYSYIPSLDNAIVSGFMSGTVLDPGTGSFYDRTTFFVSEDYGYTWKQMSCKNYLEVNSI